jgi:hypothetical protein
MLSEEIVNNVTVTDLSSTVLKLVHPVTARGIRISQPNNAKNNICPALGCG